jgi:hypothetical protein
LRSLLHHSGGLICLIEQEDIANKQSCRHHERNKEDASEGNCAEQSQDCDCTKDHQNILTAAANRRRDLRLSSCSRRSIRAISKIDHIAGRSAGA